MSAKMAANGTFLHSNEDVRFRVPKYFIILTLAYYMSYELSDLRLPFRKRFKPYTQTLKFSNIFL